MGQDATAVFGIELEDDTSGAALSAAKALSTLRDSIAADTQELAAMQKAMKNLQGSTTVNIDQFRKLQGAIDAKKSAIAQAQGSFVELGGSFAKAGQGSNAARSRFADLLKQTQQMPGPLGLLAQRFEAIKKQVGGGGVAIAILGTVAALGLLVVATGKAIAALYRYGVAQADARRSELLRLQGLTKLRNYWGVAAGNASELQGSIDRVSASSAVGRDKIAEYAAQLYKMHLRGSALEAALEGVAIKASTQGEAQAQAFAGWAAGANATGRSVRKLADDVKARLGGVARAQMLSLTVQADKSQEAFAALFNGLNIEPLLEGKAAVNALLSQATNSGKALKAILSVALQPFINSEADAQPIIKRFFQGMIIGALRIGIVLLQVRNWFKRTFGAPDILQGFSKTNAALDAGKVAVGVLGVGLGLAAVLAAGLAVKLSTLLVPALWRVVAASTQLAIRGLVIAAPFLLAAAAIFAVINTARLLYELWKEIDWKGLGTSIWKGIVSGITAGVSWVKAAIDKLGDTVWKGFKAKLGISSPSKVFARLGLAIPQGAAVGVQTGTPAVRRAVGGMVPRGPILASTVPSLRVARAPALRVGRERDAVPASPRVEATRADERAERSSAGSSRSVTLTVGDIHVHSSGENARQIVVDVKAEFARMLEGIALELGAPLPGDPA